MFDERPGRIAFWCYNIGLVMWIFLHFFPIGWPQLNAVYEHGFAWARSQAFYDQYLFWQWMRMPGDVVFSAGALLMGWDFIMKLRAPRGSVDTAKCEICGRSRSDVVQNGCGLMIKQKTSASNAAMITRGEQMLALRKRRMAAAPPILRGGFRPFFLGASAGG